MDEQEYIQSYVPVDKYKEFINANKDALLLLSRKVRSIDTVRGATTVEEVLGRQHAIKVIDSWLTDMWGITTEELPEVEVEEKLFKYNH